MSRLLRGLLLPRARQALLIESAAALLRSAWQVRRWPYRRLAASLGPASPPLPAETDGAAPVPAAAGAVDDADLRQADEVRWAIAACARACPLTLTCLMQAVAARRMLDRRGVASQLYFGVRGSSGPVAAGDRALPAHAWLRCGPLLVTGAHEAERFKAIAVYRCTPAAVPPRR